MAPRGLSAQRLKAKAKRVTDKLASVGGALPSDLQSVCAQLRSGVRHAGGQGAGGPDAACSITIISGGRAEAPAPADEKRRCRRVVRDARVMYCRAGDCMGASLHGSMVARGEGERRLLTVSGARDGAAHQG